MNVNQMILDLVAEQEQITEVIAVLTRLSSVKRRGRPPAWLAIKKPPQPETNGQRVFSDATRRKMARSQKRRWAARKVA